MGVPVGVGVGVTVGVFVGVAVGVGVPPATVATQAENSDVLFAGSVAVEVTKCPTGTVVGRIALIEAVFPTVAALVDPIKV